MRIKQLRADLKRFLKDHNLLRKWDKAKEILEGDIRHPSLNTELLQPHWRGIYSFRLDKKYRALFFMTGDKV